MVLVVDFVLFRKIFFTILLNWSEVTSNLFVCLFFFNSLLRYFYVYAPIRQVLGQWSNVLYVYGLGEFRPFSSIALLLYVCGMCPVL